MSLSQAARMGGVGSSISTGTLAAVGLGGFVLANPEKALLLLQKALLAISSDGADGSHGNQGLRSSSPQPIVIHAGGPSVVGGGGGGLGRGFYYVVLQGSLAVGIVWGSYALLVNVLPEQAKNMLPVTQGTFKQAVVSLGKGLLHVKDTLSAEISNLLAQQTELSHKQDETHEQVLYVQDQVADVHDDIGHMQTSIDDCKAALSSTDKRTTYIAKGIRLVTQGMTAMLPPDDELAKELRSFHKTDETAVMAPRHRSEDTAQRQRRSTTTMMAAPPPPSDESRASRSSRRSHHSARSLSERRRRGRAANNAEAMPRNKPVTSYDDMDVHHHHHHHCSADTLSVSTGTPIRHVMIPRKTSSSKNNHHHKTTTTASSSDETSITSTPPELKELEDIRALLVSMDKGRSAF
eukprot:scaffold5479_cov199-Amphora_coffeaeformis.AAC.68